MVREKTAYYRIGTVARMFGIHSQTLRLYEREGLLQPKRSRGNTRRYSDSDVRRVARILWLTREMGVNLAGVEIILDLRERMEKMQREMVERMAYLRSELKKEFRKRRGSLTL